MNTLLSLLFGAACVSAVQVGFAPQATSYIYRSDNNGPASLIQLGPEPYLPHQPLINGQFIPPVPLPYVVAAKNDELEDSDESHESGEEGLEYEKGAGSEYAEGHHAERGEKESKGYKSKGHHAKGGSGHYGKKHKEGYFHVNKGEKAAHHDEADAHGKHHEAGKSYKGGDHGHKKHFSKGEEVTGYHKVFNKDEFKKDHDFYDVADNSGHFNKHGHEQTHHATEGGDHKEGGKGDSGYEKGGSGRVGSYSEGELDDGEVEHSSEEGHDSHYEREAGDENKSDSEGGKKFYFSEDDDSSDSYDYDDKQ